MGCCNTRNTSGLYDTGLHEDMVLLVNRLPTLENIKAIYETLELPSPPQTSLHEKEELLFMIVNLLRVRPRVFLPQLQSLKAKCLNRQKPRELVFFADDVQTAIDLLS